MGWVKSLGFYGDEGDGISKGMRAVTAVTVALATAGAMITFPAQAEEVESTDLKESHSSADINAEGYDHFIVAYKQGNSAGHASNADAEEPTDSPEQPKIPRNVIYEELYKKGKKALEESRTSTGATVVTTDQKLSKQEADSFMNAVRDSGEVEYIEPDARMQIMSRPNDRYYDKQWALHGDFGSRIDEAWDIAPSEAQGEVIAVVDTGITSHPDLDGKVLPGYDFVRDSRLSRDTDGRDPNPTDEGDWAYAGECGYKRDAPSSWHGSHVAGIAAASTGNGEGMAGVAPKAKILPVRALAKCGGTVSDIADALVWASGGEVPDVPKNNTPAKIINMSLGGQGVCSRTYQKAINLAVENGSTVVVAAGNEGQNAGNVQPANCDNVIVVGATGDQGKPAAYTNYGAVVDISAPGGDMSSGEGILSTVNSGKTLPIGPVYAMYEGTSMATPLVSGTVALMRSVNSSLTPNAIEDIVRNSATELAASCPGGCGAGLLDAHKAVLEAGGKEKVSPTTSAQPSPTSTPSPKPTTSPQPSPLPDKPVDKPDDKTDREKDRRTWDWRWIWMRDRDRLWSPFDLLRY